MQTVSSFLKEFKSKIIIVAMIELAILLQGIYCYASLSASKSVLQIAGIAVILVAALAISLFKKTKPEESYINRLFIGALLVAGCFYLAIFPPNSVPDEIFHFQCSYKYSDLLLGEETSSSDITIRNEDKPLFDDQRVSVSLTHYEDVVKNFSLFATETGAVTVSVESAFDITSNPPQTKLVSALGITLGRLLGLGAYPVYYLGRLFNLIMFAILVFFSIKISPVGKNVFRAVALLPMTLHLAASYSYDPAIIGMSFLLTALCLKAIYGEGLISKNNLIGIGILLFLIAPCKVVYACVSLLVFLIPRERFASRKMCVAVKGGLLLIAILGVVMLRLPSLLSLAGVSSTTIVGSGDIQLDVRGSEAGHFYTMADVLNDPLRILLLYISSFGDVGYWYIETAIGSSLGWFQDSITANDLIPIAFIVILLIASLKYSEEKTVISSSLRTVSVLIVLAVWVLVSASMLLGHTFVGEPHIMGVQGRYILPVLPLLLLALHNNKIIYQGNPARAVLISAFALNLLYMNFVFAKALMIG